MKVMSLLLFWPPWYFYSGCVKSASVSSTLSFCLKVTHLKFFCRATLRIAWRFGV